MRSNYGLGGLGEQDVSLAILGLIVVCHELFKKAPSSSNGVFLAMSASNFASLSRRSFSNLRSLLSMFNPNFYVLLKISFSEEVYNAN